MKFTFILLLLSFFSIDRINAQDVQSCAHLKGNKTQGEGIKTLTPIEESEANKYDVHYYQLDLNMSNLNTNVSGTASIHAKTLDNLDSVVLELFPTLNISEIRLNGVSTPYNRANSVLKIPINASPNFSFIVEVDYAGTPPNPGTNPFGGSGVTSTYVAAITDRVTWTVSCPFLAHEWFPCKQILKDKADSSAVNITAPSTCKVGSNGVLENVVDLGNGTTRYEWKERNPILYYLICASIAPYSEYNVYAHPAQMPGDSVLIQNYIYGNASTLPSITAQCDLLPSFLELYSDLYGLYPFSDEKYGQCVAPLGGGMEHQTMTTIGVFEKKITAHELSHSWWGDHIGIASFADVWLSEGFATYSEYLMLENMYPAEKAALVNGWHSTVKSAPGGSTWCTDTLDISRIYNSRLTYKKGGSIIHTLRHIVNNDNLFFQTLRDFQNQFHDSVAIGLDLKNSFELATGIDLTNFFQEWYFGEGYPTYNLRWNAMGTNLVLEIVHTTSMPAVTPTFTNPIEIKFSRSGLSDTTIRFNINSNLEQYFIPVGATVTNVYPLDPNNWIINNATTPLNDPTFVAYAELSAVTKDNEISIFPNPTENQISINMAEPGSYILNVFDPKGKLLIKEQFKDSYFLNIEAFKSGAYLIEVISENQTEQIVRRIIKR